MSTEPEKPKLPIWQLLFGIRRREGRYLKWKLTKWGMLLTAVMVMMIGMAGFAEYSMQPAFCESCHIMQPYYQAWHQSTHKNVACVECHFLPGVGNTLYGKFQASSQAVKYITNTYGSKPHAEIHDESCLRSGCHEKRLLEGKVNWTLQTERGGEVTIHFDHTPHLTLERRGMHLRCVSCHSQIVQGRHIVVTTDTCFLCHFKGLKHGRDDQTVGTCKGCHDPPSKPIRLVTGEFNHATYTNRGVKCENCHADSVRGDGSVPKQVCWNCHNQTAQIAKYSETHLLHDEHITNHKVECSGCHIQIQHYLLAGAEEKTPGGRFAVDAGTCGMCHEQLHNGPGEMFRGVGGRGVPDMPSPMARARVNCIACHQAKGTNEQAADVIGQTFVATQDRCDYCHGDKYKGTLDDWRKQLNLLTAKAEKSVIDAKALQSKAPSDTESALRVAQLLDDADYNIRYVKLAHGVHNPTYATALLNVALDRSTQAQKILTGKEVAQSP
ncbi:MAG TPA: NapC/NirT family cytochrome c [Phycisphaerae bacterium]|nr:NapC/NirT family cytochrome c [Phycisphaerae bacterium]